MSDLSKTIASNLHSTPMVISDAVGDVLVAIKGSSLSALRFSNLQEMLEAVDVGTSISRACIGPVELLLLLISDEGRLFIVDLDDDSDGEYEEFEDAEDIEKEAQDDDEFDENGDVSANEAPMPEGFFDLLELTPPKKKVIQCVFVDDGERLLCLCDDGDVLLGTLDADWEFLSKAPHGAYDLQISVAGDAALTLSSKELQILLLDDDSSDEASTKRTHCTVDGDVVDASLSCDGEEVLFLRSDGEVVRWNVVDDVKTNLPRPPSHMKHCVLSADRHRCVVSNCEGIWVFTPKGVWEKLHEQALAPAGKTHLSTDAEYAFVLDKQDRLFRFDLLLEDKTLEKQLDFSFK